MNKKLTLQNILKTIVGMDSEIKHFKIIKE